MARGSINKVILIGTLGRDPEMRFLPNGNAVCNLNLATNEGYKDKNTGQQVEKTEWHRVSAFGRLAEVMGEYLNKGSKCYIEGKLETREYEKDGIKRYSTSILAHEMTMLDNRNAGQADSQGGFNAPHQPPASQPLTEIPQRPTNAPRNSYATGQQTAAPAQAPHTNNFNDFDDEVPF